MDAFSNNVHVLPNIVINISSELFFYLTHFIVVEVLSPVFLVVFYFCQHMLKRPLLVTYVVIGVF